MRGNAMSTNSGYYLASCSLFVLLLTSSGPGDPQDAIHRHPLTTQRIDESNLFTLHGNTRPELRTAKDLGPVSGDLQLAHLFLLMNRAPEQQQAIDDLIEQLHAPNAPQYHQWLTASEIADRFGPDEDDLSIISEWLASHGLILNGVFRADGVIDFSGSAAQVAATFR